MEVMHVDTSGFGLVKAFSYGVLVPIFAYTGVSSELTAILTVFILFDCITSLIKEVVLGRQIRSRTLWVGFAAKALLLSVPFVLIFVGRGAGIDMTPISKLVLSTFIAAEGYSILGNIIQAQRKTLISEQDAITYILKKAQEIIQNILNSIMNAK